MAIHIKLKCKACSGSGVYREDSWPKGKGVTCGECGGDGYEEIEGEEFIELKTRDDVTTVELPYGHPGTTVTYEEFKDGKRPQYANRVQ